MNQKFPLNLTNLQILEHILNFYSILCIVFIEVTDITVLNKTKWLKTFFS